MDRFEELAKTQPTDRFEQLASQNKPSLSLGRNIFEIPKGIAETGLTIATGALAQPISNLASSVALPFVGSEKAKQLQQTLMGNLTYQPESNFGQSAVQGLGLAMTPIDYGLQKVEDYGGYPARLAAENVMMVAGYKGGQKVSAPSKPKTTLSRELVQKKIDLANEYGLTPLPSELTASTMGNLAENVGSVPGLKQYKEKLIVDLTKKTHDVPRDMLVETGKQLEDPKTQATHKANLDKIYQDALSDIPQNMQEVNGIKKDIGGIELPVFTQRLQDMLDGGLVKGQPSKSLFTYLERVKENGGKWTRDDIDKLKKNGGTSGLYRTLKDELYGDLTKAGLEDTVSKLQEADAGTRFTYKSKAYNDFVNKVTDTDVQGNLFINPGKWTANYPSIISKLNKFHPDLVKQLEKINDIVTTFKDDIGIYRKSQMVKKTQMEEAMKYLPFASSAITAISGEPLLAVPILGGYGAGALTVRSGLKPTGKLYRSATPSLKLGGQR